MTSLLSGPQLFYLIIAIIVLALAITGIVWMGKLIRAEIGPREARGADPLGLAALEQVTPAVMKEAIAKGLVVPSQLAAMSPLERTFLFASLKEKLAAAGSAPDSAPASERVVAARPAVAAAAPAPKPSSPADSPPAMLSILNEEKLRVWCPMCGTELQLPVFPPLIARCTNCGNKSAIREDPGGRYTLNVSPPPKSN